MVSYFKKRPQYLILLLILLIGLFFRTYAVVDRFEFAHDGDLYSWFVKDVLVDKHLRLVGQETSAPGIFIGPLYYYLNIPFFLLTNMDPVGAIIPITIIGMLTVFSYWWVFNKLFNTNIGFIAAFLYAVLLETVQLDRRVVPSTPTNLWVIWYFYTVISLARGNFKVLPLLGVLIGLIWHIHIALAPTLLVTPFAIFLSKRLPQKKEIFTFLATLLITSLPLLIFELRHQFIQTLNFIKNLTGDESISESGLDKLQLIGKMIAKNINTLFFAPQSIHYTQNVFFVLLILLSALFLVKRKIITLKELVCLYIWIAGVVAFFSFSSSPISEYYFFNIEIIFIFIVAAYFHLMFKRSRVGALVVFSVLSAVALKNIHFLITQDYYHKGYQEKKEVVSFIKWDAYLKNLPCVGISYITTPGENVGFRYFLYLDNIHTIKPSKNVPVYTIVIPEELSPDTDIKFAHIGVILPTFLPQKKELERICSRPNTNLSDPMFGFVK